MTRDRTSTDRTRPATSDWLLAALVDMANTRVSRVGVTLTVGGILVSGQLVGGQEFFVGIAEEFASVIHDDDQASALRAFLERRAAVYGRQSEPGQPGPDGTPLFVHLGNARFFHPDGEPIPTSRGVWWRGRLDSVDGWCLGVLSPPKEASRRHAPRGASADESRGTAPPSAATA